MAASHGIKHTNGGGQLYCLHPRRVLDTNHAEAIFEEAKHAVAIWLLEGGDSESGNLVTSEAEIFQAIDSGVLGERLWTLPLFNDGCGGMMAKGAELCMWQPYGAVHVSITMIAREVNQPDASQKPLIHVQWWNIGGKTPALPSLVDQVSMDLTDLGSSTDLFDVFLGNPEVAGGNGVENVLLRHICDNVVALSKNASAFYNELEQLKGS